VIFARAILEEFLTTDNHGWIESVFICEICG